MRAIPRKISYLAGIISALTLVFCVGWFSYHLSAKSHTQATLKTLESRITLFRDYLHSELDRVDLVGGILAQNPILQNALQDKSPTPLVTQSNDILADANQKLKTSAIYLMNKSGLTISASNHALPKSFIGKNYAFRPYFTDAIKKGSGRFLALGITSNELGYYISKAVYQDKTLLGVIVIKVDINNLNNLSNESDGTFLLIDSRGIVFVSSNKDHKFKSLKHLSKDDRVFITRTKQYPITQIEKLNIKTASRLLGDEPVHIINNNNYLRKTTEIKTLGWTIWMLTDTLEIQHHAINNALIYAISCLVCLIGLFIVVKRHDDIRRFQTVVNNLPSGVILFDEKLQIRMHNDKVCKILDLPENLLDSAASSVHTLLQFNANRGEYGPGDPEELAKNMLELIQENKDYQFERTRPDGSILEIHGHWLDNKGYVTTFTDITDRKKAEEEANRNSAYLQALLQNLDQGVTVTDENLNIAFWNKAFFKLLDFPEELQKQPMRYEDFIRFNAERGEYGPGDPEQHVQARIISALKFQPHHFERTRPDGRTLEVIGKPLVVDGKNLGFISTYVDITEHKRMAEDLRKLANTDGLTGLHNRRFFSAMLNRELKRCLRSGQPLSLLALDLDHFKNINDRFGHATGDRVLKEFSKTCMEALRDVDVCGRMGGEEFAIFLPDTDRKGAKASAERLRKATENIHLLSDKGEPIPISVSIGIALFDSSNEEDNQDALLNRADKALYTAKRQGRNRVC